MNDADDGWGRGHRIAAGVESPRPRTGASEQMPTPSRSSCLCRVCCGVRGAWVLLCVRCAAPGSLPRSLARWCCSGERWLRALAFSLPTSTSSARGVVQFWLTRRPTPAAIYGHRHPGGVSGLALSSRLFSHSPLPVRQSFQSHHSRCASTTTAFRFDLHDLYHTPKIPVFDSLHDLNDIFH
jgi:hypothetical protein